MPREVESDLVGSTRRPSDSTRRRQRDLRRRIRADLQRAGVSAAFSDSICDRLEPFSEDLTAETYEAVLSGVTMAYSVHRREQREFGEEGPDVEAIEHLLSGFVSELRKLDEALETLAAYVTRLRQPAARTPRIVH